MLALGIDTSSAAGSVGLVDEDRLVGELNLRCARTHSERLLPAVRALLETAGLRHDRVDLFAVAAGPGSFTGLRIGMATAKGLALAGGRPVVGFSTLETIALASAAASGLAGEGTVCVLLNAGRGEVYRGLFRCEKRRAAALVAEAALPPGRAADGLPQRCLVCGDGLAAYREVLEARLPAGSVLLEQVPFIGAMLAWRAIDLAGRRGLRDLPPLRPRYLRLSDAERAFRG